MSGATSRRVALGALVVLYKGQRLSVGGGYSDKMRTVFWKRRKSLIGQICEFKVQDDPNEVALGRFCVFKRLRIDKNEPNEE